MKTTHNIAKFLIACILLLIFISLFGFYNIIRPHKYVSSITPNNFNIAYENITLLTSDGKRLSAWFIPNQNPKASAIILLHGYPADKGDLLFSRLFLHQDYHLLFLDFRYLGQSEGFYSSLGKNEVKDVQAAIHFLQQRGINNIGVWGNSLGAAVALLTAAHSPAIKVIVAESSYARLDWMAYDYFKIPVLRYAVGELMLLWAKLFIGYNHSENSPYIVAKNLSVPILLIHSKDDQVVPFKHAELLKNSLKNNEHAEFLFLQKTNHGELPYNMQKIIENFFNMHLNGN